MRTEAGLMTLYGLKTCDTCRTALAALRAAGKAPIMVDVRHDGVPEGLLRSWIATLGADALINTRSATWRGLDAAERAAADSAGGALALLLAHPALMKRPVIVSAAGLTVGWDAAAQARQTA